MIAAFDTRDLPFEAGRWRMKAGDLDGVFRNLDRAYNAHSIWMVGLKTYFNYPAVRRDPRFKALLAKMKIYGGQTVTTPDTIARLTAALADRFALQRELGADGMASV